MIMARYEAGETLASIARTYDCSPPAISYVVSRSRARHPATEIEPKPPSPSEPQLIKAPASDSGVAAAGKPALASTEAANGHSGARAEALGNPETAQPVPQLQLEAPVAIPSERRDHSPPRELNGFARRDTAERNGFPSDTGRDAAALPPRSAAPSSPGPHTNGTDQRRKLHLSLGNTVPGNGSSQPLELDSAGRPSFANRSQPAQSNAAVPARGRDDAAAGAFSEIRPAFDEPLRRSQSDSPPRKEGGGSFIDKELRARVDSDIAAFLAAFDAALVQDTQESRSALREATDRLLRAGARTRIELERLEARMPLPPRTTGSEPAWRHR